ncbi:MAG: S1C family serine protease [Clostridiales bacterium]|nr:S1C family serine protease [Clostridiales bacterium]
MQESQDPRKKSGNERQFITENIVKRPLTRRQILARGLLFLLLAVGFGVIAAVTFVLTQPTAEQLLRPEPETEEATVTIPQDEMTEASLPEETESEESDESETETEPVEKLVQDALENYRYTVDDVGAVVSALRAQAQKADRSIVTVRPVHQDVDWFDNLVETSDSYAGAVIAETDTELLIITLQAAVEDADSIGIIFANSEEADARMKQQDTISGIAVVSVEKEGLSEDTLESAVPLALGNSYLVKEGDMLIAVGGTAGIVHSSNYGFVSAIQTNMQMTDRTARILYSAMDADAGKGTFLLNLSGEMIGWAVVSGEETGSMVEMTEIMGISDYKSILENLINGLAAPCLGIQGQVVSDVMRENGMPSGIYVVNAVNDRPIYTAGIQSGDIITQINGHETISTNEFRNVMDSLICGQLIHVTVQRNGRDGYTELEFQVTVGAR